MDPGRDNISLNENTHCVLIHGFCKKSKVDLVLQLFEKMRKLGFRPDLPIYDVLIGGFCERKELGHELSLSLLVTAIASEQGRKWKREEKGQR